MYRDEVTAISGAMQDNIASFRRGVMFAICSIRQPVETVPSMLDEIDARGSEAEALAMPMKFEGWRYVTEHGERLRADVLAMSDRDALVRLLAVPSLGIVKAAFVLQFLGRDIGCLDTHNLRRLNIPMRKFSASNHGQKGKPAGYSTGQIDLYFELAGGKAQLLWDTWCAQVAKMRPDLFPDAEYVSRLHLAICE